jgi:hypothetical protein
VSRLPQHVDGALLAKIRVGENDGPAVNPFKASRVIEQPSQTEVEMTSATASA